jgi:ferrous iron transport protein B
MRHAHANLLVALAGQPNSGKSTIFNLLTGARQHVANFPGVTVEKKQGTYRDGDRRVEVVDLPGTYSLTSYTQEERVARDFLLLERPEALVAVVDASNLERHLYLAFQLREMRVPMVICLNMIDVARRRGVRIDTAKLSEELGIPVVATNGKSGLGGPELREAIRTAAETEDHDPGVWKLDYGEVLEPILEELTGKLEERPHLMEDFPPRWLAVKLMENDSEARRIVQHHTHDASGEAILQFVDEKRRHLREKHKSTPEKVIATVRYQTAGRIVGSAVERPPEGARTVTDKVDAVVLHRFWAPIILAVVLFVFYQIAMGDIPLVGGTWWADTLSPILFEPIRDAAATVFATADPIRMGLVESLIVDGLVGGLVAILYYVPLFFILFSLLAVLEDSGYMARVAFILDRVLRSFGLHGQSTLPLILGGVVVGGCAVPGVMATRAMKDEKARLVTILIMPLMNCLAKLPFYALMVGLLIAQGAGIYIGGYMVLGYRGLAMFGLSMFSFAAALLVAKLFSSTLVRGQPAPFVMELPVYHVPTPGGVFKRSFERVWLFLKKIVTVVAVVQVVVWFFITFPGIGFQREARYDRELAEARAELQAAAAPQNPYAGLLRGESSTEFLRVRDRVLEAKRRAGDDEARLREALAPIAAGAPELFVVANGGRTLEGEVVAQAEEAAEALRHFDAEVTALRVERRKELMHQSYAGRVGKALEPVSRLAGMEWRMNIAILATFAAKENLIGTLGTLYSAGEDEWRGISELARAANPDWTVWHKLALLAFVALFPPCLATFIVIKDEAGSWRWAIFSFFYPIVLGFALAAIVFQLGPVLFGP